MEVKTFLAIAPQISVLKMMWYMKIWIKMGGREMATIALTMTMWTMENGEVLMVDSGEWCGTHQISSHSIPHQQPHLQGP